MELLVTLKDVTVLEIGVIVALILVAGLFLLHRYWDAQQRVKNESPRQKQKQKNNREVSKGSAENSENESTAREEEALQFSEGVSEKDGRAMLRQRSVPTYQGHRDPPPPYSEACIHQASSYPQLRADGSTPKAFFDKAKEIASKIVEPGKTSDPDLTLPKIAEGISDEEDQSQLENKDKQKEPGSVKGQDREKIVIPKYIVESVTETFSFEVDERGCCVDSRYCKLQFPPGATKRPLNIKMTPNYKSYATSSDEISICPVVDFTSSDDLVFEKNVTVSLHTSYAAVEGKVLVQVIWRKDCDSVFETFIKNVEHGNERFVTFDVTHFCGYSVVANERELQNMKRHYYSAVYMREPRNETTRYLHWLIFEDCPCVSTETRRDLDNKEVVVDPESFSLKYKFNLQLSMTEDERRGGEIDITRNDRQVLLSEMWGSRVSKSFQLKIKRKTNVLGEDSEINYQLLAMHSQTRAIYSVQKEPFFLEWHYQPPVTQVNVHGKYATGVNNAFDQRNLQHQTSNVSSASSGYTSGLQTPSLEDQTFEELNSTIPESQRHMVQQDDREEEQEEQLIEEDSLLATGPLTIPKSEAGDFGSFNPRAQSTPNSIRAETVPKEREESMDSMEKAFRE